MSVWPVVLGITVVLILVQVVVYRLVWADREPLAGSEATRRSERSTGEEGRGRRRDPYEQPDAPALWESAAVQGEPSAATEGRRCPHCGTENEQEPGFDFCRSCAGRLG